MRSLTILLLFISAVGFGQIKDFSGLNVNSNENVSLSDYADNKAVVVLFTSNICPYSVYYEGRITQLIADYENDVQFLLINSHTDDKESSSEMKNKLTAWGLSIPYIADKDGAIKQMFGARKSPEVYLLAPNGATFSIYYKGAIDNNPQVASDVKDKFLKKNIDSLLKGSSPVSGSTRPIGCIIK